MAYELHIMEHVKVEGPVASAETLNPIADLAYIIKDIYKDPKYNAPNVKMIIKSDDAVVRMIGNEI